jgi:hypothetical protein
MVKRSIIEYKINGRSGADKENNLICRIGGAY